MLKFIDHWIRSFINEAADKAITRAIRDQYVENLFELIPAGNKMGAIPLMETAMRASKGIPPSRPLGSYHRFSPWERVLFNPVHLFRQPVPESISIQTSVTIGPKAQKPLTLSIPILIAGMSYGGALSSAWAGSPGFDPSAYVCEKYWLRVSRCFRFENRGRCDYPFPLTRG